MHKHYSLFITICIIATTIPLSFLWAAPPRISIITSVYKGDLFIEGFLTDIVRQTIFDQCELILINPNSPGSEEPLIQRYVTQYPNIIYIKLPYDPGVYAVWNIGILLARGEFITNANLDDRRNPTCLQIQLQALEQDPSIDLVYGDYYITYIPNETFECNSHRWVVQPPPFSLEKMYLCLPGPQPLWRKSLHTQYGYFNSTFVSAGDMEMWLRAVESGARFRYIPLVTGLYYENPQGLSTNADPTAVALRDKENGALVARYSHVWS
jgi:glycosyltransferase involved in cell wall biosynthesis